MLDLLIFVWFILAVVVTWALTRASSRLDVHHHPRMRVTPGDGPPATIRFRRNRIVPSANGYTFVDPPQKKLYGFGCESPPRIVTDDDGEP